VLVSLNIPHYHSASQNLTSGALIMSGIKISSNNESLRNALDSLRQVLTTSLGDKFQCAGTFAEIETTIGSIEQKLNDLVLDPSSIIIEHNEEFATLTPTAVQAAR
jgi:hypothetical protein